jgi:hypothetical protein
MLIRSPCFYLLATVFRVNLPRNSLEPFTPEEMKKFHIISLVFIAIAIAVLISFLQTSTTYDTVKTAMEKPGKFVHLMARWDRTKPMEYDALKNPNYLSFTAVDTLGKSVTVVYHNPKPENFELSSRLVLKGKYQDGIFDCKSIQTKCPSKYKDDMKAAEKNVQDNTQSSSNSAENKY